MDSFKCPVCRTGNVVINEKKNKGTCNHCESIFSLEANDKYILKKLGNKEYSQSFKEMKGKQNDYVGLKRHEWESIANGGLTDEEQKIKDAKEAEEKKRDELEKLIITTTPDITNHPIHSYKGIVTGQVAAGINVFKDAFAGIRNVIGGRSKALQDSMKTMREEALAEIKEEAFSKGANAVVGVSLDFDEYAEGMLLLTITGTAVVIE